MSIQVTHVATTQHEMGISIVTEIGGIAENGKMWRLSAKDFDPGKGDYYVEAGGHRIPVECHRNAAQGYDYFVAPGTEEKTDLLRHLKALS